MIRLVAVLWLFSAGAVFGAPLAHNQEEQDDLQFSAQVLAFNTSSDESVKNNEIMTQEFVKPGLSAEVKLEEGSPIEEVKLEEVSPTEKLKKEIADIELKLKAFNTSKVESLENNEITTQEFVKPGHSAEGKLDGVSPVGEVKSEEVSPIGEVKPKEVSPIGEIKPEEMSPMGEVKPKEMSPIEEDKPEDVFPIRELKMKELFPIGEIKPVKVVPIGEPKPVKVSSIGEVKPKEVSPIAEAILEKMFPIEEFKVIAEIELKQKPHNISCKNRPMKSCADEDENPMEKFRKPEYNTAGFKLWQMLSSPKKLKKPQIMELKMKNPILLPYKDFNKSGRILPWKWSPRMMFKTTERPDSPQIGGEDPIIFYFFDDPSFSGCKYVPVEPRVTFDEDFREELFHPLRYPQPMPRNNLRKNLRKYTFLTRNQEIMFRSKSDKYLEDTFKCPEENGSFSLNGHCSRYMKCQNGIPIVHDCPQDLFYNPLVNNCDLASNVNCVTS